MHLKFRGRHLSTSGWVAQYYRKVQWNAGPHKRRFSRWNFVDILTVIVRICLHLKFRGRHFGIFHFRLGLKMPYGKLKPTHKYNRWNLIDILSVSGDTTAFILNLLKHLVFPVLLPPYWNSGYSDGHDRIVPSHSPEIFRKNHQRIFANSVVPNWQRKGRKNALQSIWKAVTNT